MKVPRWDINLPDYIVAVVCCLSAISARRRGGFGCAGATGCAVGEEECQGLSLANDRGNNTSVLVARCSHPQFTRRRPCGKPYYWGGLVC